MLWVTGVYFPQFQGTIDALPCHIHLPVCLWVTEPHSRAPKRIQTMEMRCYRKILRISYKDHVTNEEARAKIQQVIGPHEDLTMVKRRKLQWYGDVSRSSGLARTILQGTLKGGRRQGRQWKRWEDNIRELTDLSVFLVLWILWWKFMYVTVL